MKSFYIATASLFILLTGCKKEEQLKSSRTVTSTQVESGKFIGVFIAGTYTNNVSGPLYINQGVSARFYSEPSLGIYQANEITVDGILINGKKLSDEDYTLYSWQGPYKFDVDRWLVLGNNGIPSFKYTNSNPFPACTDFNVLPDSISKAQGITFTVRNVSDMNWGVITFGGNDSYSYTVAPGDNTIHITPSQLTQMTVGSTSVINMQLQYGETIKVGEKNFRFVKEAQIIKSFKVIP
jgi:hypothetical protein